MESVGREFDKKHFLITSHGRTATYWLASCLNAHPDIICTHGPVLPPVLDYHSQPSDDVTKYAHETVNAFYARTIDQVFEEIEAAGHAKLYGNVHAYSADQLFKISNFEFPNRKPVIINLVRHPITRIESLTRRLLFELNFNPFIKDMLGPGFYSYVTPDVLDNITDEIGVDLNNIDVRAFIYSACFIPTNDLNDFNLPVFHIPMESLTKDIECFIWLFRQIAQGYVNITSEYIHGVFNTNRKNDHAQEMSSIRRYGLWETWKQKIFKIVMEKFDGVNTYMRFGYDVKYVCDDGEMLKLKTPLIFPIMPELVEQNYRKHNIILYKNKYFGLAQKVGSVDLAHANSQQLNDLVINKLCHIGKTLSEVRRMIDSY